MSMQVKIVLRDKDTGLYYRSPVEWVKNPYDALTFQNILEAEAFCRAESLHHVQYIQQRGYFVRSPRYSPPSRVISRSRRFATPA